MTVEEVPEPVVPPGHALVEVSHVGICGTDLSILGGHHPRARPPLVMGHEVSGWVAEPGADGPVGVERGHGVAVEPLVACGACRPCRSGTPHVCRNLRLFGIDAPGGMARFMAVPTERLHPVPDVLPLDEAALVEPLAVAVHAVRVSAFRPGDTAAVFGSGPVGLLTALVLQASAAARVIVSEADPSRLEVARGLGFQVLDARDRPVEAILDLTGGDGADLVFDAAGHPSVAEQLVAACRIRGEIVLVGIYKRPTPLDLQGIAFKEIGLVGSRVYTSADFAFARDLAATRRLPLRSLISHVLPLDDVEKGFEVAGRGGEAIKVLFRVAAA